MQTLSRQKHGTKLYHYKESGLLNVWLEGGVIYEDTPYGSGIAIKDLKGLHQAISYILVQKPKPLTGREARFLRIELDLSQKRLGNLLNTTEQAVARWEKGQTKSVRALDPALRMLWLAFDNNREIADIIERIADLDSVTAERKFVFTREASRKWHIQQAA